MSFRVIYEFSSSVCQRDDISDVDAHAPRSVQIGMFPHSDQTPDHEVLMRQQADVGHAQDRAMPVPAVAILPYFLDAGNAFQHREEDSPLIIDKRFRAPNIVS